MQKTMFTTPVLSHILHLIALLTLKLCGWKLENQKPKDLKKCVIIAAPHTSNWDFIYTLLLAFAARMPIYWTGKKEIFKFPFGWLMRFMGGISVDRCNPKIDMIESIAKKIKQSSSLYMLIQPEGTRGKVEKWKTGFYRIAVAAEVPILMGFLDFSRKCGGFIGVFNPTTNMQADIDTIRKEYKHIRGKHAHRQSKV